MKTKEKLRKYYRKPQIHQVKLDLGEAVLAFCKVGSKQSYPAGGPSGNLKCDNPSGCLNGSFGS